MIQSECLSCIFKLQLFFWLSSAQNNPSSKMSTCFSINTIPTNCCHYSYPISCIKRCIRRYHRVQNSSANLANTSFYLQLLSSRQYLTMIYSIASNLTKSVLSVTRNDTESNNVFFNIWSCVFFIILFLNLSGNSLVIVVIAKDKKFHSMMNCLFANMAFSDFLAGIFAFLWYLANYIDPAWLNEWICRLVAANTITVLSGIVSIFSLTAITLERYRAILKPLEHRMSWCRLKLILFVIWFFSGICSLPYFIFIKFVDAQNQTRCMFLLGEWEKQLLTILMFAFVYACPNIIICSAYAKIVKHLWFNKENEEMQESHKALLQSRKKITKLLGFVLIVFNLCVLPNFAIADFMLSFGATGYGHAVSFIGFLIQFVSTCVNPLIFFIQSKQFRNRLFGILFCRNKRINRWSELRVTVVSTKSQVGSISKHCQTAVWFMKVYIWITMFNYYSGIDSMLYFYMRLMYAFSSINIPWRMFSFGWKDAVKYKYLSGYMKTKLMRCTCIGIISF